MEQKRVEASNNAEIAQLELRRNKIITYFSVSFLIGGLFVGIRWKRLTDKNLKLNKDLFEQKKNELEILEREKVTSKKLIELSARVLDKSKDLKQTISGLPDKSNPEIRKSLDDLENLLLMNKSVDTTVITRGYALEQFSFLDGITNSQRNVLSLSLDGYRPKEIAVTLNLSYSYVRNVQSKLRKILKNQGFDNFEDFKNDINP
jgi:DNA-binding CsgD family transcriptional regulator